MVRAEFAAVVPLLGLGDPLFDVLLLQEPGLGHGDGVVGVGRPQVQVVRALGDDDGDDRVRDRAQDSSGGPRIQKSIAGKNAESLFY